MPMAPWATAGSMSSVARTVLAASARPRRLSPASASNVASISPRPTLSRRVPILPRRGTTITSGRRCSTWAPRRSEAVPTTAPEGRPSRPPPWREIQASRGSSRSSTQEITVPDATSVGTSFIECTARSMRPSSRAMSISLVNKPLPPISARDRSRIASPVVRITSTSSTKAASTALRRSRTSSL